ncbi:hypothetical protein LXL04_007282 [Taraxacum kok-saghyz]
MAGMAKVRRYGGVGGMAPPWSARCVQESRSFENSYIPENPRTPKPLTFSKNRLRGAKNRSNISPIKFVVNFGMLHLGTPTTPTDSAKRSLNVITILWTFKLGRREYIPTRHRVDQVRMMLEITRPLSAMLMQGRSKSGYVFTIGNTAISWRSCKETLVATSTNHSELLALYEATRECVWL